MKTKETFRYIIGYVIGFSIFAIIIPYCLHRIAIGFPARIIGNHLLRSAIGFPLLALGLFFVIWSNADLFLIGKGGPAEGFNIPVSPRTKHLVTTGVYAYTRNPMVFGALCSYFALSILFNSWICLVLIIILLFAVRVYLRLTEEKRLEKDFGDEFRAYRQRVPMIFPKILKSK